MISNEFQTESSNIGKRKVEAIFYLSPLHQNVETKNAKMKNVEKNMVESKNVDVKKVEIKNVES